MASRFTLQAIVPISYYNIIEINIYMEGSEKIDPSKFIKEATLEINFSGVAFLFCLFNIRKKK